MIHDIKHDVNNDENDNDDAHIQIYETMTQHLKTSEDVKTVKLGRRNNLKFAIIFYEMRIRLVVMWLTTVNGQHYSINGTTTK